MSSVITCRIAGGSPVRRPDISAYLVSMLVLHSLSRVVAINMYRGVIPYFSKPPMTANVSYNGTWMVESKFCSASGSVADDDTVMRKVIGKIISRSM